MRLKYLGLATLSVICSASFGAGHVCFAQAQDLSAGVVIERVTTEADAGQSYALYLPTSYGAGRRFPIIYCFDPAARGRVPVERFREAAERFGWIVAASNNSRNGPLAPSLAAANAVFEDTRRRLSIDAGRVYLAGFSGGARLAVRLASSCEGCVAGVVAAGAGFPSDLAPSASTPFALFAAAGVDDFNFPELIGLEKELGRLGVAHRVELFEGGHDWPAPAVAAAALGWMELRAMRGGRRGRDEALVEALWQEGSREARLREEAGDLYAAHRAYRALASDYEGLRDVAGARRDAARLEGAKEVLRAAGEQREQVRRQHELSSELLSLLAARRGFEQRVEASAAFEKALARLRKEARAPADGGDRRVARRVLGGLFVRLYEQARGLVKSQKNRGEAIFNLEAASEIETENPHVLFELACLYSLERDKKKALVALGRAVEKGFGDVAALTDNKALDALRGEAEFKRIVEKLQTRR